MDAASDHFQPGPNRCQDRLPQVPIAAWRRLGTCSCQVISALVWNVGPDWVIKRRTCVDTLLFFALSGAVEIEIAGVWWPIHPGELAIIPARVVHAARYRGTCRSWQVIAVHTLMQDAVAGDVWAGFAQPVHAAAAWKNSLLDLVGACNRGEAEPGPVLRALALSLLSAGAAYVPPSVADARIAQALVLLSEQPDIGVSQVAQRVGLSPARFRQCFRAVVGQAPKPWLQALRLTRAAQHLRSSTAAVQEVAAEFGFANDHQFHRAFKRFHGCTPSEWRRRGQAL